MPIYEYRCASCGFEKEYLQKLSDVPLVDCPKCGKPTLNKKVSAAGFQLKGSGWYATDFKSKAAKPAVESPKSDDKKSAPESKTAPESKSGTDDSKPAPATKGGDGGPPHSN